MRRGAVYYHRAVVPKDIKDTYGKTEEVTYLRTKDRAEAIRRARVLDVEIDEKFDAHRRKLQPTTPDGSWTRSEHEGSANNGAKLTYANGGLAAVLFHQVTVKIIYSA
ncbi:MAG: DUF6538 domain-containing protein [Cognatishimia sp.]